MAASPDAVYAIGSGHRVYKHSGPGLAKSFVVSANAPELWYVVVWKLDAQMLAVAQSVMRSSAQSSALILQDRSSP